MPCYTCHMPTTPTPADDAEALCLACGLCCDGSLFLWAKLRPNEMKPAADAGLPVFMDAPPQRGFTQPCPMWHGVCGLYGQAAYPHACRSYRCKLLKQLQNSDIPLASAIQTVDQTRADMAALLAALDGAGFAKPGAGLRQRLVHLLEHPHEYPPALQAPAKDLLQHIETVYGVTDILED